MNVAVSSSHDTGGDRSLNEATLERAVTTSAEPLPVLPAARPSLPDQLTNSLPHIFEIAPSLGVRISQGTHESEHRCVDFSVYTPERRCPIFRISSDRVPVEVVPYLISEVQTAVALHPTSSPGSTPPPEVVEALVGTLRSLRVPFWGKVIPTGTLLGETIEPSFITRRYKSMLQSVVAESAQERVNLVEARVIHKDSSVTLRTGATANLCEPVQDGEVLWLNLLQPSKEQLESLCQTLNIPAATFFTSSDSQTYFEQVESGRYGLAYDLVEPTRVNESEPTTAFNAIRVFVNRELVITIAAKPSRCLSWVSSELDRCANPFHARVSAHTLATRLIGSCLHENKKYLNNLFQQASDLRTSWADKLPTPGEQREIEHISSTASQIGRYILNGIGLIDRVGQEDQLFEATSKSPRLQEYEKRCGIIRELAQSIESMVQALHVSWETNANRERGQYQTRLAILAASLLPFSAVTSFFGMNSAPVVEPSTLYLFLGTSLIVSLGLLWGLRYKLKSP
jgi:Mg2+ and Co2+ transporter CorA